MHQSKAENALSFMILSKTLDSIRKRDKKTVNIERMIRYRVIILKLCPVSAIRTVSGGVFSDNFIDILKTIVIEPFQICHHGLEQLRRHQYCFLIEICSNKMDIGD